LTFSIAIPVHNGENFLEAALTSAIDQKRSADEILAVDDGSTDRSAEILKAEKWGGKIRYVYNENPTGYADAWNRVVKYSRSEFVSILHQDDLLDQEYLFRIEEASKMFPDCKHFYTGYYYIDGGGNRTAESPLPHAIGPERFRGKEYAHRYLQGVLVNRHLHRCPGVTTQRQLILSKCPYRKEAGLIADDDFFLRVGEFTDVVGISQPLASFREHGESATGKLESLSHRLAIDYIFQTKYYRSQRSLLDETDIGHIEDQANRFIDTYLVESMINDDSPGVRAARILRNELETVQPMYFGKRRTLLSAALWTIVREKDPGPFAGKVYSIILRSLLRAKKTLRHTLSNEKSREMSNL
jgi:glycosyltransferase involved in cell wall biosynthesis